VIFLLFDTIYNVKIIDFHERKQISSRGSYSNETC
jgi:hypothetical protein